MSSDEEGNPLGFSVPQWVQLTDEFSKRTGLMYIEDVRHNGERAYGWRFCAEVDKTKSIISECRWDYSPECLEPKETKLSWARTWIPLSKYEVETEYDTYTPIIRNFSKPEIYRIAEDRLVSYGDGGESFLFYPVWVCDKLPVDKPVRASLTQALDELEGERKDRQIGTPVEDIIDPDLFPLRIPEGDHAKRIMDNSKRRRERILRNKHKYILTRYLPKLENPEESIADEVSQGVKMRETYQWIPSEFHIHANGTVKIASRIHNLPRTKENNALYSHIELVFSKMLPMFVKMHLVTLGKECTLQVIVKAQRYRLPPHTSYAGRWHVEGVTENIAGVGVYYCEVDKELEGGNLKFRPSNAPQPWYGIATDYEVEVSQGSAVVFSNCIPHRFRTMKNPTDRELKRTFINFFVVDPTQPLKTTKEVVSCGELRWRLSLWVKQNLKQILPTDVMQHIIGYTGQFSSLREAKEFRKEVREKMKEDLSGWGYIHWGNCGFMEFIGARSTYCDAINNFRHTDSDKAPSETETLN